MLQALDATAVRRWYQWGLAALDASRDEINSLNVFPVPDADTGTNLHLTLESAIKPDDEELPAFDHAHLAETALSMARLALLGARGSSGVILSQLLRGVAEVLAAQRLPPRGLGLARALERAVELAYAAVSQPVEGTMLTVARAAATAARATGSDDLPTVVDAAAAAARDALADTPRQLDVLGRAGVVDAGGRGVVVLLDVLQAVVNERALPMIRRPVARPRLEAVSDAGGPATQTPAYEVMYLLDAADERIPALRADLDRFGDSVVVSGGDGLWHVHVHTDDANAVVDTAAAIGRPHRVKVTPLRSFDDADHEDDGPDSHAVVVVIGDGSAWRALRAVFNDAGAFVVEATPDLADRLLGFGARRLLLLVDTACTSSALEVAKSLRGKGVQTQVVAAKSAVQVLAAVALHDPYRSLADEAAAMTAAVVATRCAFVRSDGDIFVGVADGDTFVGVADGSEPVRSGDPLEVVTALLDRLLSADAEIVTVVAAPAYCRRIAETMRDEKHQLDIATIPAAIDEIWLGVE